METDCCLAAPVSQNNVRHVFSSVAPIDFRSILWLRSGILRLAAIGGFVLFFGVSCFIWRSPEDMIYTSCNEMLVALPNSVTGQYIIDPDGDGIGEPFVTLCDMETDGGGWTLVGIISLWDEDSWIDLDVWTNTTTFGDLDVANDYKNA